MIEAHSGVEEWLEGWADVPYAYLTTTGRRTGNPHRIEIWFAADNGRLYMLAGGRDRSDWVRNIQANGKVTIELGDETRSGMARILRDGTDEDQLARELLVTKYGTPEKPLADWKQRSLAVVIEFPDAANRSPAHGNGQAGV